MNNIKDTKALLMPLLKGSPLIIVCAIIAFFIARKTFNYITPQYESTAKIKLDDSSMGVRNTILYKDFDLMPTSNKIKTEVEIIKSREFLKLVGEKLEWDISFFLVGKLKKTEIKDENFYSLTYNLEDKSHYQRPFEIHPINKTEYFLKYSAKGKTVQQICQFECICQNDGFEFNLEFNYDKVNIDEIIKNKNHFYFKINSIQSITNKISNNLDIKALDKDIPILRISFKDPIAKKTTQVVNTIAQSYIEDYVRFKSETARKTVKFIDERLKEISEKLKKSETHLEDYKLKNNIAHLKLETETGLKKLAELQVQQVNLEMNEAALNQLDKYINETDEDFIYLAPQVGFGDLLFTEMIKKLKGYQSEKRELLKKYQSDHENIIIIDKNIEETVDYIKASIKNAKNDISIKKKSILNNVKKVESKFTNLPSLEKEIVILQRNFQQNQRTYNYLIEKKSESSIAAASEISFHRILQLATIPKAPVSPNKTLIYFISVFLSLVFSTTLIYLLHFLNNKLKNREDIEKQTELPILGTLANKNKSQESFQDGINAIANKLTLKDKLQEHQAVCISSAIRQEGKSFVAINLAKTLSLMGWKTALIDFNLRNPELHKFTNAQIKFGISDFILDACTIDEIIIPSQHPNLTIITTGNHIENPGILIGNRNLKSKLKKLKKKFDLLIIDTPATASVIDGIKIMSLCELNIYTTRANYTSSENLLNADLLKEQYKIKNLHLLLNKVEKNTTYEGYFKNNKLSYSKTGFWQKIKNTIDYLTPKRRSKKTA